MVGLQRESLLVFGQRLLRLTMQLHGDAHGKIRIRERRSLVDGMEHKERRCRASGCMSAQHLPLVRFHGAYQNEHAIGGEHRQRRDQRKPIAREHEEQSDRYGVGHDEHGNLIGQRSPNRMSDESHEPQDCDRPKSEQRQTQDRRIALEEADVLVVGNLEVVEEKPELGRDSAQETQRLLANVAQTLPEPVVRHFTRFQSPSQAAIGFLCEVALFESRVAADEIGNEVSAVRIPREVAGVKILSALRSERNDLMRRDEVVHGGRQDRQDAAQE